MIIYIAVEVSYDENGYRYQDNITASIDKNMVLAVAKKYIRSDVPIVGNDYSYELDDDSVYHMWIEEFNDN